MSRILTNYRVISRTMAKDYLVPDHFFAKQAFESSPKHTEALRWIIDLDAKPIPTATLEIRRFISPTKTDGFPDQWLDLDGNLRGKGGKIIFAYGGGSGGLDS